MDILIIASLIIGAVILFLVELFVIPGISVAGFLAGGCIIFANYYAFAYMGTTAGVITLIISAPILSARWYGSCAPRHSTKLH